MKKNLIYLIQFIFAILSALVAALNTQVNSLLATDFVATNTVTAFATFKSYSTNAVLESDLFTSTVVTYSCVVDVFVKIV